MVNTSQRKGVVSLPALQGSESVQTTDASLTLSHPILNVDVRLTHHSESKSCVGVQAAAKTFNVPNFSGDAMDVINHPEVDAVWICSPSQFHADQVRSCMLFNYEQMKRANQQNL